jgi:23S rRNA (uracil1939-C5)-methyltransferase
VSGSPRPGRRPLPRHEIEATVDGFTHGGEGVARVEGKAVFVPGALPGERIRMRVVDDRKRWARAELLEVVDASPDRVEPPCPYVPACGGCDLQHVSPPGQRRLKTRVVREQLIRLGGIDDPPVDDCREVGPAIGYRTHAQFHAAPDGRLGFHRAGTHEVVPIDRCLVLTPATQAVRDTIGDETGAAEVAVRAHPTTGTSAAIITPGAGGLSLPDSDMDLLLVQPDGATLAMRGDGRLAEVVAGVRYGFAASSFFQVTTHGAQALVETVLAILGDVSGALVWDLYAGVGLFSLPLARAGAEVVTVEGHAAASADAVTNAEEAGLSLRVLTEPVQAMTARAAGGDPELEPPELVVLDPPRTGAGEQVTADLIALAPPQIVYVACDPAALARDARTLTTGGYRLDRAIPLDLFPMTHHVEVVASFVR